MTIGYTHSMFTGNLRAIALKLDKKENNGNDNGLIDGKEINQFKALVKQKYGVDFDFNSIKQSSVKEIAIKDNEGNYIYNNGMELSSKYKNNGTNSKIINHLNGGDPFAKYSNTKAKIPYMNEADFKKSQEYVNQKEEDVKARIEAEKPQENVQSEPSCLDMVIAWLKDRWLRH